MAILILDSLVPGVVVRGDVEVVAMRLGASDKANPQTKRERTSMRQLRSSGYLAQAEGAFGLEGEMSPTGETPGTGRSCRLLDAWVGLSWRKPEGRTPPGLLEN